METSLSHIRHQLPVLGALSAVIGKTVLKKAKKPLPALPSREIKEVIPKRPRKLIDDYIAFTKGDPERYKGLVPFHFFPQWSFPIGAKSNLDLPYDFTKIINLGCRIEVNGPIRSEESLHLTGRLESIDDNPYRAIITNKLITQTPTSPHAIVAYQTAMIPKKRREKAPGEKKQVKRVPTRAELIETLSLDAHAGLDFALLTGDFNPLHWLPLYAKTMGFKTTILHGYATMSLAIETLIRRGFVSGKGGIKQVDVKFTGPLQIPGKAGVFVDPQKEGVFYVGAAAGGKAYLTGTWR